MHLDRDLQIRRAAGSTLPSDVAIGVGNGWHRLVERALADLREVAVDRAFVRQVKEKWGLLALQIDVARSSLPDDAVQRVFNIVASAAEASAVVCEMCGGEGRFIRQAPYRVRCEACEVDEPARCAVIGRYRAEFNEACRYYVDMCIEQGRLLPVDNVIMQIVSTEKEHQFFLNEVYDRLCSYRAGAWIEGVDEGMRNRFWRLRF